MQNVAKVSWCAIIAVIALFTLAQGQAQKADKIMRVGGEVTAVDQGAGTVTIKTSSGPSMTVRPPQGGRGRGGSKAGESVVVQFNQSAAQGATDSGLTLLGVGGGRRPGTVEATSMTPLSAGFCSCAGKRTDGGCEGSCAGPAQNGWSCKILEGIVYTNVCGLEQP